MLNKDTLLQKRYRILRQIGGGGMGTVYLAEDTRLQGRRCAIKEMSPAQLAPADRNWSIEAFRQEAQMLANLDHPGLTRVTDFFAEGGCWYLTMDYVEGETLEARLARARGGRLPLDQALRIARQLCDVLTYLHNRNPQVIFRDLKPANIMLTPDDEVKLIDFGIARFFKPGKSQDTIQLGTPGYAAPEQYGGLGQSDPRTDIYSLGALLHQMVTGYDPTTAASPFPLPDPRSVRPNLPPHVADVIVRATQMRPDFRYSTVQEMRQALFPPTYPLPGQTQVYPSQQPTPPPAGSWGSTPPPGQPPVQTGPTTGPTGQTAPTGGSARGLWMGLAIAVAVLVLCTGGALGAIATGIIPLPSQETATPESPTTVAPTDPPTTTLAEDSTVEPKEENAPPTTEAPTEEETSPPTDTPTAPPSTTPLLIAYVRGNVGTTDIYVADADGNNRRCVACQSCDEAEPAWSSDGQWVLYQADCGGSYDIWMVSSEGGTPQQLTRASGTDEREPAMSPDGSRIVYRIQPAGTGRNEDGELHVMNADGSGSYGLGIWGRSPEWSPDGNRLTFMSERDGSWEIYVYNFNNETTTKLSNCSANCRWPAWSPDGSAVVYHSTTSASSVTAETIWITELSDKATTQLVSGYHTGRPSWSSEGYIAFNSDRGIEVVNADGGQRRILIANDINWAPVWSK
ncbi:MAG: protein kinase domain-containing protein [Anaerolineae bacterium]